MGTNQGGIGMARAVPREIPACNLLTLNWTYVRDTGYRQTPGLNLSVSHTPDAMCLSAPANSGELGSRDRKQVSQST